MERYTTIHSGKELGIPDWVTIGTELNADWCYAIKLLAAYEDLANTPAELAELLQKVNDGRLVEIVMCKYCKYLTQSEITNRLWCAYHSDGEYQHETYLDYFCNNGRKADK